MPLGQIAAWVAFLWLDRPNVEGWRTAGGTITSLVLLAVGRALFDRWLELHRAAGRYCRSVVLVGTEADVDEVSHLLADHPELGYQIAQEIPDDVWEAFEGLVRAGYDRYLIAEPN